MPDTAITRPVTIDGETYQLAPGQTAPVPGLVSVRAETRRSRSGIWLRGVYRFSPTGQWYYTTSTYASEDLALGTATDRLATATTAERP